MADQRAVARISGQAIRANAARLASELTGGSQLCAVVKAGGYGHGAAVAARAALDGGATSLAVATATEARDLREEGFGGPILVMGALTPAELGIALAARADVVAWTPEFARSLPADTRVHVKLDSGMGRLGTADPAEAAELVATLDDRTDVELVAVMTHFATADEPGDDHFPRQLARFTEFAAEVRASRPHVSAHAANSAATVRDHAAHFDMVRCGIALYGLDPYQGDPATSGLEPALELASYVASVKHFEPGDSAGYGRRFVATEPTWIATLPIGYADGWRRGLTNDCDVLIGGTRHPLAGTVSMDNVTVDLGPQTAVSTGDEAILIGAQGAERILAEEVAARLGTINYEVTCGIGPRVPREYR